MAARKQFAESVPVDEALEKLLFNVKSKPVTDDELREQRISFAFGNAPDSDLITKDTVRATSLSLRLKV